MGWVMGRFRLGPRDAVVWKHSRWRHLSQSGLAWPTSSAWPDASSGQLRAPKPFGPECRYLPEWDWYDISAHLRCTRWGAVGYVDTRLNWAEVIDFNKGVA
jgi:hypothetical protein